MGFSSEFNDKPYNEHPVTIYPGPNLQFHRQSISPTYNLQKISPSNTRSSERKGNVKRDIRSDGEMLSPKGKIPPRTLAGSMEKHREVCRGSSEDVMNNSNRRTSSKNNEDDHFSDDSLEESFPPPPPVVTTPLKRNSIAWEVSLDGDDPLLTPGSTKVRCYCYYTIISNYAIAKRVQIYYLCKFNSLIVLRNIENSDG